jgi:hypothetical protein
MHLSAFSACTVRVVGAAARCAVHTPPQLQSEGCSTPFWQAIYQDIPEAGEVGAVTRRTRNNEDNRQYGQWWGARSTGSCSGVDELTWFIR